MKDTNNFTNVEVVPIILSVTGVLKTNFSTYLGMLPRYASPLELQLEIVKKRVSIPK